MNIFTGIADALHCLHDRPAPICHLDVRCGNVLLDERGLAKLGDFGLAHFDWRAKRPPTAHQPVIRTSSHRDLNERPVTVDCSNAAISNMRRASFGRDQSKHEQRSVEMPIRWISPEQLFDAQFSEKSDVYMFGVTIWEV